MSDHVKKIRQELKPIMAERDYDLQIIHQIDCRLEGLNASKEVSEKEANDYGHRFSFETFILKKFLSGTCVLSALLLFVGVFTLFSSLPFVALFCNFLCFVFIGFVLPILLEKPLLNSKPLLERKQHFEDMAKLCKGKGLTCESRINYLKERQAVLKHRVETIEPVLLEQLAALLTLLTRLEKTEELSTIEYDLYQELKKKPMAS